MLPLLLPLNAIELSTTTWQGQLAGGGDGEANEELELVALELDRAVEVLAAVESRDRAREDG